MEIQNAKMSNDWAKSVIIGITVYMTPQTQVETKKKEEKSSRAKYAGNISRHCKWAMRDKVGFQ